MVVLETESGLRGELRYDEPLASHTTWRVGGPAKRFYRPVDAQDLARFLASLPTDEPLLWLGLGSNLLVRDGGFNGSVIALAGCLSDLRIDGRQVMAGAGVACAKVARECARAGLTGGSFLAGIPGTMGGALAMNAGAFGSETWERVSEVTVLRRSGEMLTRYPGDYQVAYRHVEGPRDEWFIGCVLQLATGDAGQEQAAIKTLLEKRAATQPTGKPSGGSTFRNPPGDYAARLVEACGLKKHRIGGAEVSEKHANFVLNANDASAQDIEDLIGYMHDEVRRQQGVDLQCEVHIVGDPA